jgi:hypothetical protein
MSSSAASCSTCCRAASSASATSATSPTANVLCCCRSACSYSPVHQTSLLETHPLPQTILTRIGTALSAAGPCMSSNGSPPPSFCFVPRLDTSTPHEPATTLSNHPRAPARTETLCLTPLRLLYRSSFTPLPSILQQLLSAPSLTTTAVHRRHPQPRKSSGPAQPHTKPIGSRKGRLPSSRCIRSAPFAPVPP